MKNTTKIIITSAIVAMAIGGFVGITNDRLLKVMGAEKSTVLTVNQSVTDSTSFVSTDYTLPTNEHFTLHFDHVKNSSTGIGVIKAGSYVRRTAATNAIKSITVSFSGETELKVQSWYDSDDIVKYTYDLKSNTPQTLAGNYFCLIAGSTADITLNSITVDFGCSAAAARPNTSTGPSKVPLTNYADMNYVFTWDDETNDVSWYVIGLELKNEKEWGDTITDGFGGAAFSGVVFPNRYKGHRLYDTDSERMQIDEVRLLTSGRMEIFVNIFATNVWSSQVPQSGYLYAHLSYDSYVWDNDKGDVKPKTYNGGTLSDNGTKKTHGTGGCSKGTYTASSAWGMANLDIVRK